MNNIDKEAFERWWHNEGSGMLRHNDEGVTEWVHRMAEIAWTNGADVARRQWPAATASTPGDDDCFFRAWPCELAKDEWGKTEAELRGWFAGDH